MKAIQWTAMVLTVVVLCGWSAAGEKSDAERLTGIWRIASAVGDGQALPSELIVLARFKFTKDGKSIFTVLGVEEDAPTEYTLVRPGRIDIAVEPGHQPSPAIYKFDGKDKLVLCWDVNGGRRPTKFTGDKGSGQALMTLTRAKPGEEKLTKEEAAKYADVIAKLKARADWAQRSNNLKFIGLAMHGYADTYKTFPLHAIYSKDGKTPLLSWRVAILPYVEEAKLYQQFKLDEPWDSPNNKKLISRMPKIYALKGATAGKGMTHYQVITGPGTPFDGNKKIGLRDLVRGSSNTILAIEAKEPVIWTKPADVTLPAEKSKLPALGLRMDGVLVLTFDAAVKLHRADEDPAELRAMMLLKGK